MDLNQITESIIGCAIKVHKKLGPGLLESAYQTCLAFEFRQLNLNFKEQLGLPLVYEEIKMELGYRLDFLVENSVVVEIKSVESLNDIHTAQVLTYLKLSGAEVGLLLNFNTIRVKDGLKRLVARGFKD
jgi:GxxExxY protein